MPGLVAIVSAISNDVVAGLAAASLPPLVEGSILMGHNRINDNTSPPRIIMTPTKSSFGARDLSDASNAGSKYTQAARTAISRRAIFSDMVTFEVRCWGAGTTREQDFDQTQLLYQQLIASCQAVMPGAFLLSDGTWTDVTEHTTLGREFVFNLQVNTPIFASLAVPAAPFAPAGTTGNVTDTIITPSGASGTGCI